MGVLKPDARYKILDSPLEDAVVRWGSDSLEAAQKMCNSLNRINANQRGPWDGGRYWIDDTEKP